MKTKTKIPTIILIMGLSGAGKTEFAKLLHSLCPTNDWFNADAIRTIHDDWDFSTEGRIRQATRMRALATESLQPTVIIDMICPLKEMRRIIQPDAIFFIDRVSDSQYKNTDLIFDRPTEGECATFYRIR